MATQPRPAFERKSGTLDYPDDYTRKMIHWRDALIEQASYEMQSYREVQTEIQKYIAYLDSQWWARDRPDYRSSFFDNYLADVRRETLSSLTSTRPAMDVYSPIEAYKDHGTIVNNYIKHVWVNNDLDLKLVEWIDHSLFGTGFWKMSAYEPGIIDITSHGLDEVLPVMMQGQDLQTARAVVYRTFQSLEYFIAKFGREKADGLERYGLRVSTSQGTEKYQRPGNIPEYTWNAMAPPMRRLKSMTFARPAIQDSMAYSPFHILDLCEIYSDDWTFNDNGHPVLIKHPDLDIKDHNYHYIVPPGARIFPRKRLVVFGGDRVMYDGPSPWWHGLYPYIMLQLNPCVWGPGGISKYRDIIPLVKVINRIGAGVDELIIQAINGTYIGKRGAIDPVSWERFQPGKPSQKLLMNMNGNPATDIRRMDPPQLPSYVESFLRYLVETVKRRSGSIDIMGLARKKQAPSGEAVENMRDTMSSPFQLEGRYVEAGLKRAAIQAVSHVFQFADLSRRLMVLGPDGQTWQDYQPPIGKMVLPHPQEDHWKKFAVHIAPGSMHGASKFQKKSEAVLLRRQGDLSRKGLWRLAEIPDDVNLVEKELMAERKEGIGPATKGSARQTRSQRQGNPL